MIILFLLQPFFVIMTCRYFIELLLLTFFTIYESKLFIVILLVGNKA
jgi:hypothetical protein